MLTTNELLDAGADREFASLAKFAEDELMALFYGTTPGAYAGWDTRRRGGGIEKKSVDDVKLLINSGSVRKTDLAGLTVKDLLGIKKSLGIKHSGTKQSLVEKIHGKVSSKTNARKPETIHRGSGNSKGIARLAPGPKGDGIQSNDVHIQAQSGDEKAKAEVVKKYQGLIHSIVKNYSGNAQDKEDMVQEGNRGVLRALHDYDPSKSSFVTHATNWIRNYVGKAANKSYTQTKAAGGTEEKPDLIDTKSSSPSTVAESGEVHDMLKSLDKRSADVLKSRYGIGGGDPKTLEETAKSLGITRQRVQQIEVAALKKLRGTSAEFSLEVDEMIERAEIYAYMLFSDEEANFAGTTAGALKGWDTRRRNAAAKETVDKVKGEDITTQGEKNGEQEKKMKAKKLTIDNVNQQNIANHLESIKNNPNGRFSISGDDLAKLLAANQGENKKTSPPVSQETVKHSAYKELTNLLTEKYSFSKLVPIHEIRQEIRASLGDSAATHASLDEALQELRREGKIRLVAISDLSEATKQQLNDSIDGYGETLFYAEKQ